MLYLIAFLAAFGVVCVLATWACPLLEADQSETRAGAGGRTTEPAGPPESLEGALVAQLMTGEITAGQYRRAVEGLAARDDERHPLAVPPDTGTADA